MRAALSVLLPCYQSAATLGDALDSLWRQSFTDFEVIAVDDGSTDGTREILAQAARREPRLVVCGAPHCGIASSLTRASNEARTPLLARMDADDIAHPERLRMQLGHLRSNPELAVSSTRVRLFPREDLKDGYLRYESWVNGVLSDRDFRRNLFVESPVPHPSVMMRREAFDAVGGYRDSGWPEDYDLWMRVAFAGYRFEKLPEVLLDWRDHPARASRRAATFGADRFMEVKAHYLTHHVLEPGRDLAVWGAGPVGKSWAKRFRPSYLIELDPRKVGQRIHGAEVVASSDKSRLRGAFVLVAVAALSRRRDAENPWRSARDDIRDELESAGFEELRDFVCVA